MFIFIPNLQLYPLNLKIASLNCTGYLYTETTIENDRCLARQIKISHSSLIRQRFSTVMIGQFTLQLQNHLTNFVFSLKMKYTFLKSPRPCHFKYAKICAKI